MTKLFKITKHAWIAFFVALVASFIMASAALAQENIGSPEEVAKKYGITFPIEQLGSCQNYAQCRNFCEDPVNSTTCIDFAKAKGFYKEEQTDVQKSGILEKAKAILGCDSYETCQNFCQIPTNFDKCDAFAKQNNLTGGHTANPEEKKILERAKEILGCDSPATCAAYCSDDANRNKCSQFAKETGLRGGERPVGPGGCSSEETCRAFCSDPQNYSVCSGFAGSAGGKFQGPGGCSSEESCRAYCQDHESECRTLGGPGGGPPGGYNPQEMCNRTPNCAWNNNTCVCSSGGFGGSEEEKRRAEEYAKICRENPDKCTPGGVGTYSPPPAGQYSPVPTSYPSGSSYPTSNYQPSSYDPATECSKSPGCSWTGSSCQCSSSGGSTGITTSTPPTYQSQPTSESQPTYAPPPTQQSQPAPAPVQESAPAPAPSPTVQGITIVRGLLDQILDLFRR